MTKKTQAVHANLVAVPLYAPKMTKLYHPRMNLSLCRQRLVTMFLSSGMAGVILKIITI
jgi:hypothetical protein